MTLIVEQVEVVAGRVEGVEGVLEAIENLLLKHWILTPLTP
jgi:hypothetical protein